MSWKLLSGTHNMLPKPKTISISGKTIKKELQIICTRENTIPTRQSISNTSNTSAFSKALCKISYVISEIIAEKLMQYLQMVGPPFQCHCCPVSPDYFFSLSHHCFFLP